MQRLEAALDSAKSGPLWLRRPKVAQLLMVGSAWLQKKHHWEIPAFVVMPNHYHCLMFVGENTRESLETSLGIMKGFVGRQANRILDRTGKPFWTPENFDHWCRHAGKTAWVIDYIRDNPVKAGLVTSRKQWPWAK